MYITLMPVIFAGITNMFYTKTKFYRNHCSPIDGGMKFYDGRQIFGNNKTWTGFWGMVFFGAIFQLLWGAVCFAIKPLENINELYNNFSNNPAFNLASGAILGFAYVLFELPNSFIKRRLNITPGKIAGGIKGVFFFIIDQIDSLIGVVMTLNFFSKMSFVKYWLYIFLGALTHVIVNLILYALKIRKNI